QIGEERKKRLKGQIGASQMMNIGTIFPNMSFHGHIFPRTIAVWHPVSTEVTEGWRWLLVDKDAPQEVKDYARHLFLRYSGPAGMVEQDDMENWNYAT